MLDVYRSFYGLSGEPFRLGPDHRFSLHHTSYANAKAYLDYAIYQGEGFIAITGGPGTGKTTLISEILATLDRSRVQVATLTSTQLESRDLLHMVASSFGMHPDRFNKADLLLEIESYLVKKLRSGQRAMLIVDEAQGLSNAALEELRLLANLQYQYQLLLQICLVGQEKLLELIHSPGMEHLQQRLVAATSLEPLNFDETIDYIEHRLGKVGWQSDPSIDEAALRLIHRYSGGTPRRINLLVNRLFLYGGMEHKHQLTGADAQAVIEGLVEEHLLGAQPPIDDASIGPPQAAPGEKPRSRCLPRAGGPKKPAARPTADSAPANKAGPGRVSRAAGEGLKWDTDNLPGSRPQARPGTAAGDAGDAGEDTRRRQPDTTETTRTRTRQPSFAARSPEPPLEDLLRPHRPARAAPEKKTGGKGLALVALLAIAAGATYYLRTNPESMDMVSRVIHEQTDIQPPVTTTSSLPVDNSDTSMAEPVAGEAGGEQPADAGDDTLSGSASGERGAIIRERDANAVPQDAETPELAGASDATPAPDAVADGAAIPADAASVSGTDAADAVQAQPESVETASGDTAVAAPTPVAATDDRQTESVPPADTHDAAVGKPPAEAGAITTAAATDAAMPAATGAAATSSAATGARAGTSTAAASSSTAKQVPDRVASARPAAVPAPANNNKGAAADSIDAQREQLRAEAERRFSRQLAQVQSDVAATVPVVAPAAPVAKSVKAAPVVARTASPPASPAAASTSGGTDIAAAQPAAPLPEPKKKPLTSADDIKALLLDGRWSSSNKPASLLPSETTFCNLRATGIHCVSVPQNVKTQYGLALYKVETDLSGFSAEGLFEMSYRTLVKLVDAKAADWQVTEYSMSCKLSGDDRVSCLDGKGITREYRRLPR